jgi:hypothetical protein
MPDFLGDGSTVQEAQPPFIGKGKSPKMMGLPTSTPKPVIGMKGIKLNKSDHC